MRYSLIGCSKTCTYTYILLSLFIPTFLLLHNLNVCIKRAALKFFVVALIKSVVLLSLGNTGE